MKIFGVISVLGAVCLMAGCAAQNVKDAGVGLQLGSVAGSSPLAPFVFGAGVITDLVGSNMADKNALTPGTPEYAWRKKFILDAAAQDAVLNRFKRQALLTVETTPDQIRVAARNVCGDIDKIVAEKGSLKVSKKELGLDKLPSGTDISAFLPSDDADYVVIPLDQNPYGPKCVERLELVGKRLVDRAKKAANK